MQLPVASITTSSVFFNCRPKPSRAVRVISTRPSCRVRLFSQITTSPKVGWISIPITRRMRASLASDKKAGAAGDTPTTDSRSQRNRASRRCGQLLTRARSSSCASACPHLRAPGASVPDARSIYPDPRIRAEHRHRDHHAGYKPDRAPERRDQATHRRRRHLPQLWCHRPPCRDLAPRTERRIGRSTRPLHDAGNHSADGR